MSELKPCPFCGGDVRIITIGEEERSWHMVSRGIEDACKCRVFMESRLFYDGESGEEQKNELIEVWNTRVGEHK